jgi:hypothetical protein
LKQQAEILNAFVNSYKNLWDGKGIAPAYSQIGKGTDKDDQVKRTVAAAEEDLLRDGIDKDVILKHKDIIKEWLEVVIIKDDDDDDEGEDDDQASTQVEGKIQSVCWSSPYSEPN